MKPSNVAEAMAMRPINVEAPIYKDVRSLAQIIKRALMDVKTNFIPVHTTRSGVQYHAMVKDLAKTTNAPTNDNSVVSRYGDLNVLITPAERGSSDAALFMRPASIVLSYNADSVGDKTDFRSVIRAWEDAIEHELRHYVGFQTRVDSSLFKTKKHIDGNFAAYYNQEHEVDARLTALFLKVDSLFRGSAILAMRDNKIDSLSKQHHDLLRNNKITDFVEYVIAVDARFNMQSMSLKLLYPAMYEECVYKIGEFYKFLYVEYGMALRAIPKEKVTKKMKDAWIELHKNNNKSKQNETAIKHIAETDK